MGLYISDQTGIRYSEKFQKPEQRQRDKNRVNEAEENRSGAILVSQLIDRRLYELRILGGQRLPREAKRDGRLRR